MTEAKYVAWRAYREYPPEQMKRLARALCTDMQRRRSVREFSSRPASREVIEQCVLTAGSAPSGANMQPWFFVVVSDADLKRRIRVAAERAEHEFYRGLASEQWLDDLSALGTDEQKPFLEEAPYLIVVFAQQHAVEPNGSRHVNYYVRESVGIATGMLIAAVHNAGLASLPYTPSKTGFLNELLGRPGSERPVMVLVVGYPAEDVTVPDIRKKTLDEIAAFV
jgi:nitroreductase